MKAYLVLEDGTTFAGEAIGALGEVVCEIVFNTAMTGYLEVLTDPSYMGQGVVMTYPLIGNYGVNLEDCESRQPYAKAFIVRELAEFESNFRSELALRDFLKKHKIPGIQGIDTRALTKILREKGTMNGAVTYNPDSVDLNKVKEYTRTGAVKMVSSREKQKYGAGGKFNVALLDCGCKASIVQSLVDRGCEVTVYPAETSAEEIISAKHDGIMLSNGPGDPKDCTDIIENLKKLIDADQTIFGICLGHQLLALASGWDTCKLKYGHRGANHPVKDLETGRVYITSQNHGYMVIEDSVDKSVAEISYINVNDGTVEGIKYLNKNIFSVQFHPEASPGPHDTSYLFDRFINMMEGNKNA